jgi:hypothetical protein
LSIIRIRIGAVSALGKGTEIFQLPFKYNIFSRFTACFAPVSELIYYRPDLAFVSPSKEHLECAELLHLHLSRCMWESYVTDVPVNKFFK